MIGTKDRNIILCYLDGEIQSSSSWATNLPKTGKPVGEEKEGDHEKGEYDCRVLREPIHLLQEPEHGYQCWKLSWGILHLATLTNLANFRISTEVSDSCAMRSISSKIQKVTHLQMYSRDAGHEVRWHAVKKIGQEVLAFSSHTLAASCLSQRHCLASLPWEPGAERGHTRASVAHQVVVVAHQVVEGAGCVEQVKRKSCDQVRHEPTFGL